ncbi:putative lipid II flippase FtsW [Dysosmobacter sp. NSJ-60]|nr:putative lipid II flippase FtsW [Dysosmobacter hominis]
MSQQRRTYNQRQALSRYEERRRQEEARREMLQRRREKEQESRELAKGPIDLPFCLLVLLLTAVGLVMLLSASFPSAYYTTKNNDPTYYFVRQGVFAVMGVAAMFFIGKINYQRFRGVAKFLMYISVVMLVLVIIPGNPFAFTVNNATRWLGLNATLRFQPSEIAKVAVVIYFSDSISKKKDQMRSFRYGILPYAIWLVVLGGLVGLEPHLSGAILIMGVGAALMLVGGINWAWVIGAVGAAGAAMYLVLFVIGYNTSRITYWLNPWADAQGAGWQLSQSLITIGSGGLWGVGLGKSRQKFLYLPEEHNDFIFAIICEELGLIGASIIMLLFAALILRGYWIALHARDRFGSLLVVGITTLVAMQTFLNIGVVTGLLPTTGISLPFFSYGGTALSIQLAEMGIVLSVSRQMRPTRAG